MRQCVRQCMRAPIGGVGSSARVPPVRRRGEAAPLGRAWLGWGSCLEGAFAVPRTARSGERVPAVGAVRKPRSHSRGRDAMEDGRVTLLVFGDSYVADPLVPRTWPILLADRLGWRSANFAAPGYVERKSAAQASDRPRLSEARSSLRHALPRKEASGEPAGRGLSRLVFDSRCQAAGVAR